MVHAAGPGGGGLSLPEKPQPLLRVMQLTFPGSDMAILKRYLGWSKGDSPLVVAAQVLLDNAPSSCDGTLDLSQTMITVASGRTTRLLLWALLEEARRRKLPLVPPQMCRIGALRQRSLQANSTLRCASAVEWHMALAEALNELPESAAKLLLPGGALGSPRARMNTANQFLRVIEHASSANLTPAAVADLAAVSPSPTCHARWMALDELASSAMSILRGWAPHLRSPLEFQLVLNNSGTTSLTKLVLLGIVDATPATRSTIARLESLGVVVEAFVVAGSEADHPWFDDLGCVRADALITGPDLQDSQLELADGPDDQCQAALARYAVIEHASADDAQLHDSGKTVIVNCDPAMGAALGRAVAGHGRTAHLGSGLAFAKSLTGQLLAAIAQSCGSDSADDLIQLIQLPCTMDLLRQHKSSLDPAGTMDQARSEHLVNDLEHMRALGLTRTSQPRGRELVEAWGEMLGEFAPGKGQIPNSASASSPTWGILAEQLTRRMHGALKGSLGPPEQFAAFGHFEQEAVSIRESAFANKPCGPEAVVALMESRTRDVPIPIPPDGDEVEVIGWLDSLFDPATGVVILAMREGTVPASPKPDGWLTDGIRVEMALNHRQQTLARDSFLLRAIAARTQHLAVIVGQTDAEGEPASGSRLLIPTEYPSRAHRICLLLGENKTARERLALPQVAESSGFLALPSPDDYSDIAPSSSIRVTAFKKYLDSPYLYWLTEVLQLSNYECGTLSMSPAHFGSLMHSTAAKLADDTVRDCTDAATLKQYLEKSLRERVIEQFGKNPKAGVLLQTETLVERVQALVDWHLRDREAGWRLHNVEWSLPDNTSIAVDGVEQIVRGRIDRIDHNADTGAWRIIDYKTSDEPELPYDAMRKKKEDEGVIIWLDLQLPLYRHLCAKHHPDMGGCTAEIGYVVIPANSAPAEFLPLNTLPDEDSLALEKAESIIRSIRKREFGGPATCDPNDSAIQRLLRVECLRPAAESLMAQVDDD